MEELYHSLFKKLKLKVPGVRHNTEVDYKTVINILAKETFGNQRIDRVKLLDVKIWLIKLKKYDRSYSSVYSIRGALSPAFQMEVDDELLRKNPFEF